MGLTKLKQFFQFQFSISLNTISGVVADNNDVLHVVWKTDSHKGKLKTHYLHKPDNGGAPQTINLWQQQLIEIKESLCLDAATKSFDVNMLTFQLKREKNDMTEIIGEFRTDLGLYVSTVLSENEFSVDVPSQKYEHLKTSITVRFKLLEKTAVREMLAITNDSANVSSTIQELRQEMARVSNDYSVLKTLVMDSQSFSKSDYWVEKLPDMELNLRQYTAKVDELSTYVHKIVEDTKVTVLDDKITELQAKVFADHEKLQRLSDFYSAYTHSTAQELAKMRERAKSPIPNPQDEAKEHLGTWSHPRRGPPKHISLHQINFDQQNGSPQKETLSPVRPTLSRGISMTNMSNMTNMNMANMSMDKYGSLPRGFSMPNNFEAELQAKFALLDDFRIQLQQLESDNRQLSSRISLNETDAKELHQATESLKWERQKDMENFYLFQKSQSQFAEELSKIKLQINDAHSLPRKLEQRTELLEVYMEKVKRAFAGMKTSGGGGGGVAVSESSDLRSKALDDSISIPQPSFSLPTSSALNPPYHRFLLDHCFSYASDSDPSGDLLVPAYFLVKFCSDSLDLADSTEDWSVFDGLFFALHFELKKHSKSPTHLLFWLVNISFILEQLSQNVFPTFQAIPSISENAVSFQAT